MAEHEDREDEEVYEQISQEDEESWLEHEGEMREMVSAVMRADWLSEDTERVQKNLDELREYHKMIHFTMLHLSRQIEMRQAAQEFMEHLLGDALAGIPGMHIQVGEVDIEEDRESLHRWSVIHFAVEYFDLMVSDHLRRLTGETPIDGLLPEPFTSNSKD